MENFRGTGVALVTPFNDDGSVDYKGLERLVNHCIDGGPSASGKGVEYLVVMGTTAENATLTSDEKLQVLQFVQKVNNKRKPVVYGIGGNNTQALLKLIEETDFSDIDALLSVSPYYNKPTQEGIYQHYKILSQAAPKPIILYNVPGRTSSNITAETTLRLANDCRSIIGIKEASGDMEQVMKIINERPEGFLVISGDDNITLPMIACGGDGVISVSTQGFPAVFTEMVRKALNSELEQARELHYRLFEVTKMLFEEGNPGGIKAALSAMDICGEHMRQPLWPISDDLRSRIRKQIEVHNLNS